MTNLEQTLVHEALTHFGLSAPEVTFLRHNENITCRVVDGANAYVLRIRHPQEGFDMSIFGNETSPAELARGEAMLLHHLAQHADFPVQSPVVAPDGKPYCLLSDGSPASLLRWVDGDTLNADPDGSYAYSLGRLCAKLHQATEGFIGPRNRYGHNLIAPMQAELTAAETANHITAAQHRACSDALNEIDRCMTYLDAQPDATALIHSDMSFSNILVTPEGLAPIDFSLSGYGYRAQECGLLACFYENPAHQAALCRGYEEESGLTLDQHAVDCFIALSTLLFITCQHSRFAGQDWFDDALNRWCSTMFLPLCRRCSECCKQS